MQQRQQQQLLTCNKGKLLTCTELYSFKVMLYHVFCTEQKETINTFKKKPHLFSLAFTLFNLLQVWALSCLACCLKVVPATFLLVCFVCLKSSTCETRKNVFYFTYNQIWTF